MSVLFGFCRYPVPSGSLLLVQFVERYWRFVSRTYGISQIGGVVFDCMCCRRQKRKVVACDEEINEGELNEGDTKFREM